MVATRLSDAVASARGSSPLQVPRVTRRTLLTGSALAITGWSTVQETPPS